jgi:hypothetical protein
MYQRLTAFFACTTIILAAALAWLVAPRLAPAGPEDTGIIFPPKLFVGVPAYVAAKGTLVADWLAYKNNNYSFRCVPEECIVASFEQIGNNQVSSVDGPVTYPVTRWSADGEVVAESDSLCSHITITLDRQTRSVLWVETPIHQTEIYCKRAYTNIRKATLETSLFWRRPADGE